MNSRLLMVKPEPSLLLSLQASNERPKHAAEREDRSELMKQLATRLPFDVPASKSTNQLASERLRSHVRAVVGMGSLRVRQVG